MYNETCIKIISMEEEIIHAEEEDIDQAKSSSLKEEQQADESEEGEEESGWTSYLDTESSCSIDSSILLQLPEISAYNNRSSSTNYCYHFMNDYNSSLLLCQDEYRVAQQNTTAKYSCDNFFCCKYMLDDCQTVLAQSGNMSDVEEEGFREAAPCLPDQESLGSSSTTLSSTASDASCSRSNVNMRHNYNSAIISGDGAAADQYFCNGPHSSPDGEDHVVHELVMPMILHRFSNSCSRDKLPQNQQTFKRNRPKFHARFPADRSVLGLQQLDHHLHLQDTASSCSPASTLMAHEINLNGEAGDVSQRFKALEALIPRLKEVAGNANEEEMLNVIINHVQNLELKVELLSNVWRLSRLKKY